MQQLRGPERLWSSGTHRLARGASYVCVYGIWICACAPGAPAARMWKGKSRSPIKSMRP